MNTREEIIEKLGIDKRFFVNKLIENKVGVIKLAFVREVISPMIVRNNHAEETTTFNAPDGRDLIEIPARKLKAKEKRLGLMICRSTKVVDENVRYNSIFDVAHMANPNSVLFGDSVTKSDGGALNSRVVYDWAYSLRDTQDGRVEKLQHNSISEEGTIIKAKDVNKEPRKQTNTVAPQALHSVEYVMPGTLFPHFVTIDNTTPELLVHLLFCVLNEHKYGAQITTMGSNVNNHLVGIAFSDFEKPINSYTVSRSWYEQQQQENPPEVTVNNLVEFMKSEILKQYKSGFLNNMTDILNWLDSLWNNSDKRTTIYKQAQDDAQAYLQALKMIK